MLSLRPSRVSDGPRDFTFFFVTKEVRRYRSWLEEERGAPPD